MPYPPIRLLRPSALKIDATTPCVLEINIPIPLPHRLDTDTDNDNGTDADTTPPDSFLDTHVQPFVRRLIPQIATHLFGSAPDADIYDTNHLDQLLTSWESGTVRDKQHGFDFAGRGWWCDDRGGEGRGVVHAYNEFVDHVQVLHSFRFYLVRGVSDAAGLRAANPKVLRLDVVEGEGRLYDGGAGQQQVEEGAVVFEVREYTEEMRETYVNPIVAWLMEDAEEEARRCGVSPTLSRNIQRI